MKKVCLQAGHKGMTSGATGAAGERDWTTRIVPMIAERLRAKGIEVYETDSFGYEDVKVTDTDWDLFLAIHYDADVYNESGGFVDFADPSTDKATVESQRIAKILSDHYFQMTGIKNISRSNANTRFYYMWKSLSLKTPCVLIECGVGNRKPNDYEVLRRYDFIADAISGGILKALGIASYLDEDIPSGVEDAHKLKEVERYNKYWTYNELINDWVVLSKEVIYERQEKEKYKSEARDLREVVESQAEKIATATKEIESSNQANAGLKAEIAQLQAQFSTVSNERDGLIDACKGNEIVISKLKARVSELEAKLMSQDPLSAYTKKELWEELRKRIFKR